MEKNLTTSAFWHSAYFSTASPLQTDDNICKIYNNDKLYIYANKLWLTLQRLAVVLSLQNHQTMLLIRHESSSSQMASSPLTGMKHHCVLGSAGSFVSVHHYHFHYLLFLHAKSNISAWPPVFEGPVLVAGVSVFNIFWAALLGNRLGVAWPWFCRNNGQRLTGT